MNKTPSTLSRTIAIQFAILFVLVTILSLLLLGLQRSLLKPSVLARALEKQDFYALLPALAAEQLSETMGFDPCAEDPSQCEGEGPSDSDEAGGGGPEGFLGTLSQEGWETFLTVLMPPEWMQEQVESGLAQFSDGLSSDEDSFSVLISFRELKSGMQGERGIQAIQALTKDRDACSDRTIDEYLESVQIDLDRIMSCQPTSAQLERIKEKVGTQLDEVVDMIPDETDLVASLFQDGDGDGPGPSGSPLNFLRMFLTVARLSPLLSLALLLLVTLFAVRSLKGLLRWWGIPFLVTGMLSLLIAVIMLPALNWALATLVAPSISIPISSDLLKAGMELIRELVRSMVMFIVIAAGALGAAGLGMLFASLFVKPKSETPPEAA